MKVDISMTSSKEQFYAHSWWADDATFVLHTLRAQLTAASVVFPELRDYAIAEVKQKGSRGGKVGGHARAAALAPERRKEIAQNAARARWHKNGESVESDRPTIENADGTTIY